ncbi:hypothetical protein MVES1_001480 [Malassezia vespertilionis]|uniref:uncharacterized protein n=1 Tax=Malassezia vespertilionis TaxID=2020962 RepID=UPI0024B21B17|nr:uncharacterized protein MVES1_001480 [Malassezia vespertilionis]WFD06138.1 hypothetical protein MVES1_001480 [Malassezia vespertilionis]
MSTVQPVKSCSYADTSVFQEYHDPSTHILFTVIFGIYACVFIYYAITRRPKIEYVLMIIFAVLEVGAFTLRIYGEIIDGMIMFIVYSCAIVPSITVMYLMYARWCKIANGYYQQKSYDMGMYNPVFIAFAIVLFIGFIIANVWVPTYMWVVYLAMVLAIWIVAIVALIRHRRNVPLQREKVIVLSQLKRRFNVKPVVTSWKQLDNMMVLLIVCMTVLLVKQIFLTISFALIPVFFLSPFYYVFSVLPDLAFCTMLASPESIQLFEQSRHIPEARAEMEERFNEEPGALKAGPTPLHAAAVQGPALQSQVAPVAPIEPIAPTDYPAASYPVANYPAANYPVTDYPLVANPGQAPPTTEPQQVLGHQVISIPHDAHAHQPHLPSAY